MADFFIKYSYVLFAFFISLIISTLAVRKEIPRLKKPQVWTVLHY